MFIFVSILRNKMTVVIMKGYGYSDLALSQGIRILNNNYGGEASAEGTTCKYNFPPKIIKTVSS